MKKVLSMLTMLLVVLTLLPGAALAQDTKAEVAQTLVQKLYDGEYEAVFNASAPDLQQAIGSADGFATVMMQIGQMYGALEAITGVSMMETQGYFVASVVCMHAKAEITYQIVLDADSLLKGLTLSEVTEKTAPGTVDASLFTAEPVTLREGESDATSGILTLPVGDGPFPAVIMMQGSGPSDMDETAYGIAVFRDLAEGLAAAGVASIRYDKYSFAHKDILAANPDLLARFTVNEEYVLDAQAALALLQQDERIGDIYLLGHSQGAMLAPRIMQTLGADNIAGAVLLAGSPLHLWELQYHQNLALIGTLAQADQPAAREQLDAEAGKAAALKTMTPDALKQTTLFGISAYYQADEMSVDAAQIALALKKPLLIAQGAKDWQVTPADGIEAWQAALGDGDFAAYKLYPDMNHMLVDMAGESTGTTADYVGGSHVKQELIDDIAAWVLGR
ncbi:MAG TPA: alpha/beta fold hydrolase [Candidatus Limiplasma sp.]|nr:alpha/beta fold hydrolase [Candidatus Limiplasma sp.]